MDTSYDQEFDKLFAPHEEFLKNSLAAALIDDEVSGFSEIMEGIKAVLRSTLSADEQAIQTEAEGCFTAMVAYHRAAGLSCTIEEFGDIIDGIIDDMVLRMSEIGAQGDDSV